MSVEENNPQPHTPGTAGARHPGDLPAGFQGDPQDTPSTRPTQLDYEADPLLRLERNHRSTRQAIWFFIGIITTTTIAAIGIWIVSQIVGGPFCDRDTTANLCSRGFQLSFAIIPTAIAAFGLFGGALITYIKWRRHERWRPWIAVVWFIMPFAMSWVTSVGAFLLLDHL